jgi:hypothetical protein
MQTTTQARLQESRDLSRLVYTDKGIRLRSEREAMRPEAIRAACLLAGIILSIVVIGASIVRALVEGGAR